MTFSSSSATSGAASIVYMQEMGAGERSEWPSITGNSKGISQEKHRPNKPRGEGLSIIGGLNKAWRWGRTQRQKGYSRNGQE